MKLEKILEGIEEIDKYNIEDNYILVEFWTDTAGQDVPVEIEHSGSISDFVAQFEEYAKSYNVNEEVELYVPMRGKKGVPDEISVLLSDCKEVKSTLLIIADKLKKAII